MNGRLQGWDRRNRQQIPTARGRIAIFVRPNPAVWVLTVLKRSLLAPVTDHRSSGDQESFGYRETGGAGVNRRCSATSDGYEFQDLSCFPLAPQPAKARRCAASARYWQWATGS